MSKRTDQIFIQGLETLNKKLRQLESKGKDIARESLQKAAITIQNNAQGLAPVDTGRLKVSITHQMSKEGQKLGARVGTNVKYAPYQEFGVPDRGIPGKNYLFRGYKMSLATIFRIFTKALKGLK